MEVFTIANGKGGSGKSTIALAIIDAALNKSMRVKVLDFDTQSKIAVWAGIDAKRETEGQKRRFPAISEKNLLVKAMGALDDDPQTALKTLKAERDDNFDILLCDTAGEIRDATGALMAFSDLVICPTNASGIEQDSVAATKDTYENFISHFKLDLNADDRFKIVVTQRAQFVSNSFTENLAALKEIGTVILGPMSSETYNDAYLYGATISQHRERAKHLKELVDKKLSDKANPLTTEQKKELRNMKSKADRNVTRDAKAIQYAEDLFVALNEGN